MGSFADKTKRLIFIECFCLRWAPLPADMIILSLYFHSSEFLVGVKKYLMKLGKTPDLREYIIPWATEK